MMSPLPHTDLELGTPKAQFKMKNGRYIFGGVLGIVLGMVMVCLSLNTLTEESNGMCLCGWGLGVFGFGLLSGFKAFRKRNSRIAVFSKGFRWIEEKETAPAIRWTDIDTVWQDVTVHTYYGIIKFHTSRRYTVQLRDGQKLRFDNYSVKDVEVLGNLIQRQVTKKLLPSVIKALKSGNEISFGKLSVSARGLSNGKEMITWRQIEYVRLDRGIIIIKKKGKRFNWSSIPVAKIPNMLILVTLIDKAVGIK